MRWCAAEDGSEEPQRIAPAVAAAYRSAFESYCDEIEAYCARNAFLYVRERTHADFEDLVLRALRRLGLIR